MDRPLELKRWLINLNVRFVYPSLGYTKARIPSTMAIRRHAALASGESGNQSDRRPEDRPPI